MFRLFSFLILLLPPLLFPAKGSSVEKGRKIIRMRETRIEGRIQKPQVTYILQRSGKVQLMLDSGVSRFRPHFGEELSTYMKESFLNPLSEGKRE